MKKNIILLTLSFCGMCTIIFLSAFLTVIDSPVWLTIAAAGSLIFKIIFFVIAVYTLISASKIQSGKGVRIFKFINWVYVILLSFMFVFMIYTGINMLADNYKYFNTSELKVIPDTAVKAKINPLIDYNGLSKDFILALRSGNIDSNFTKMINYSPKPDVWANMEDKGSWFALDKSVCFNNKTDCRRKAKGLSAMSRIINNPMILIAPVMIATYHLDETLPVCSDEGLRLIPQKLYLDAVNNKIIAVYKGTKALTKCKYLQLSGLNARDIGYEWAKVYKKQNISFPYPDNISKKVYQFKDSITVGSFCEDKNKPGVKCNVLSPVDDKVVFRVTSYPANIELKLWNKKPVSRYTAADIKFEIRFVEELPAEK